MKLNRRTFLRTAGCSTFALALAGNSDNASSARDRKERPNFIFILTDDQRHDAMGCAGNPLIHTPNIDSLAARGMRFDKAFVTLSICSPSRAACLTGRYGSATGVTSVPGTLNKNERTFCHYLKNAGYRAGMVGTKKKKRGESPFLVSTFISV